MGGVTSTHWVRQVPSELTGTLGTHSPCIAVELEACPNMEVIMLGGGLFRHSIVGVGAATLAAIAQIRADVYFMGVCSLHPQAGLTTGDFEEACIKRALSAAAAKTIVLASSEKLATAAPYQVVPLAAISAIIFSAMCS